MQPLTPQTLLMHLLAWDSSAAAARSRFIFPAAGWFERRKLLPRARQRAEGLDAYAPLRDWLRQHVAAWPDLVVGESIIQEIPPVLTEGLTRRKVAMVVQHVLKAAGCKPLGLVAGIRGYHEANAARMWAIRDAARFAAMSSADLLRAYAAQDPATVERFRRPDHAAGDAAVRWLRHHAPALPALVYAPDLAAMLPGALPLTHGQRVHVAERFLREIGARHLGEHQLNGRRVKLWAVRDVERLAALRPRERMREAFAP